MKRSFVLVAAIVVGMLSLPVRVSAQQYRLKQVTQMMGGMKIESTIYVKGMRKRTETAGMMGMGGSTVIEQCDLKRTVKLNDKKKLYFIEPFSQGIDDVADYNKPKPGFPANEKKPRKGGVITMWYNITDTGERKKMFGFTARHVWTSQKMKSSADACTMKDSVSIKTDGWYIDLPEFNCPVTYQPPRMPAEGVQPDCVDSFVIHQQGSGKLGFPLVQTVTIITANSKTEFSTSMETIELSTATLDSALFGIPPGYQLAKNEEELQDKMDVQDMMRAMDSNKNANEVAANENKAAGTIRIGVMAPNGNEQVQKQLLQQKLIGVITSSRLEAVAVSDENEAKKMNCDYLLSTTFTNIKEQDKAKGLLKAITRRDPNVTPSFAIQASMALTLLSSGQILSQQPIDGKYEGRIDEAAAKALSEACEQVVKTLRE